MEEAKQHGKEEKLKTSSVYPEETRKTESEKGKKGGKSWKSSLISWWKSDKKSKVKEESTNNSNSKVYVKKQCHVSGPINSSYKGPHGKKQWRPSSGPLTNLFKPTKREENEIPYMCLHQENNPQNYGPLYVVT